MDVPKGAIPRIERQSAHEQFLEATRPRQAEMKITHARRLLQDGIRPTEYLRGGDLLTTSTVADRHLDNIGLEREFEYIRDLAPRWHVPADHSDYVDLPVEQRVERIERTMKGTVWMARRFELVDDLRRVAKVVRRPPTREDVHTRGENTPEEFEALFGEEWKRVLERCGLPTREGQFNPSRLGLVDVDLIPLMKGATRQERDICYAAFDALEVDTVAVYATRYFSAKKGCNIKNLVADIEDIQEERPALDVVVVGMMSPHYLRRFPNNVVGAAGQHAWRSEIKPRERSAGEMQLIYEMLEKDVWAALPRLNADASSVSDAVAADPEYAAASADD